jgi:hypothetical protein
MSRRLVICIIVLLFWSSHDLTAQTTVAAANGSWALGANWIGGTAPGFSGLGGTNITINTTSPKYIQVGAYGSNQNLGFAANNEARSITVNGTLVVYGDVTFANKAVDLVIPLGGVVIILGNLTMNNKLDLSLGGILVVKGTFSKTGNQGDFDGTGAVYAGGYSGDAGSFVDDGSEFDVNPDLNNNPSLDYIQYFLETNGQYPLPVELLSFTAKQSGESIALAWATASELNFNYFAVERSTNGKNFTEIGKVEGHGTTKIRHDYSFDDKTPQVGKNYYRLKTVDFDGYIEYHDVIVQDYTGNKEFHIYPNPSDGASIKYHMNFAPDENSVIAIYNSQGMKVGSTFTPSHDSNLTFSNPLNRGVYYVKFVSNNFTKIERLVVR